MSGTILRRHDRTARPPRVEHYSSAVNIVLVAMANKTARVAWALLRYERIYEPVPA